MMRIKCTRRGAALLELAFSFMIVFGLFAGTFQWGYTFYVYDQLVTQVREGARYASTRTYDVSADAFTNSVRNVVVYGEPNPAPDSRPKVTGLEPSNVAVIAGPDSVTVSINGFTVDSIFGKITLEGRPNATFPHTSAAAD